jgi:hypothetical protein
MTLDQIKQAIKDNKTVCYKNNAYIVIKDSIGQYLIQCTINDSCIGLTWRDGLTMNGNQTDFYIRGTI